MLISLSLLARGGNTLYFSKKKTVYDINSDYDLAGKNVTIPEGCTLRFNGGIIRNGSLIGCGTSIEAKNQQIFDTNISFAGTWLVDSWIPEWFGAKGVIGQLDAKAIQCALDAAKNY